MEASAFVHFHLVLFFVSPHNGAINAYVLNRMTSLWQAADEGNMVGVVAAVKNGANVNSKGGILGETALHKASWGGHTSIADYLIEHGADINSRNNGGELPIHFACMFGHLDTVKLLLNKGGDFKSADKYGDTPLHDASLYGRPSTADYLIQYGADVNSRNRYGKLPIHYACRKGHLDTVKLLLNKGSDFKSADIFGYTPVDLALKYGYNSVADYFILHGAEPTEQYRQRMQAAVSETLKHGEKKNNRISLLFIGQARVGKTSLKKSILGEVSNKKEPSTIGIEFDVIEVQENDKSKPWRRATDEQFIASEDYIDGVLGKEVARKIAESQDEPGQGGGESGSRDPGDQCEGKSGDGTRTEDGDGDGAKDEVGQEDKDRAIDGVGQGDKDRAIEGVGQRDEGGSRSEAEDGNNCRSDHDERTKNDEATNNNQNSTRNQLSYDISDDLQRKIVEEMKIVENYRDDTMDTIRFMLGDVGGQSVYYDVHSIMLRLRTLFILVVDLSRSLDDEAQPTFVEKGTKKTRNQENPLHETNFDYVIRWMAALRNLNPRIKEAENKLTQRFHLPKTILVFTKPDKLRNREKLDQKLKEVTEALEQSFERIGCDSLIVAKYVIKNTKPRNAYEDDQLRALRDTIFKTAQDILKAQEKTPMNWLLLERALDSLRRSENLKDRPYITLDEAQELGEQCQVNETFSEAMEFFHEENIVVHFDGNPLVSDVVVLDPAWLVKLFTQVLTVAPKPFWGTSNSRAWKKLTTEGVLDFEKLPNELDKHSQKEALKDIMVQVGLICHWRKNIYLVPSMVTKRWKESDICKVLSSCWQPTLYLDFNDDTIPVGLYTRFQVELLKWSRGDIDHNDVAMPEFHDNCCRIFKCENGIQYSVILIRHVSRIQVAISVDDEMIERNGIATSVLSALRGAMTKILSCPSYQGVRYDFGLKCDLCREEKTTCLRHQKETCTDEDCVCILTLECLKKKSISCPRNRCGKNSSELHTTFWVNITGNESTMVVPLEKDTGDKTERAHPDETTRGLSAPSASRAFSGVEGKQTPPDSLRMDEIVLIARRIPNTWVDLAYLTKKFESHDVEDIVCSRCNEDESKKARDMLMKYSDRGGTRQKLADALKKLGMFSLSQDVLSGCYIDDA